MQNKRGGGIKIQTNLAPLIRYQPIDEDWLDYLYHNTYYGGAELPISYYTIKKRPLFANTRFAILAITLLLFIPLLAAFAGEGSLFITESSLTGLAGAEAEGTTYKAITAANPYQGVIGHGEGTTYIIGSGFLTGNRRPTHETPILNSTNQYNNTLGELSCYNQSTADEDNDAITNQYQWYDSWGTPATTIIKNEWENTTTITTDKIALGHTYTCLITPNDGQEDGNPLNSTPLTVNQYTPPPEPISGGARGTEGISAGGSYGGVMAQPVECITDEDCLEDEKCLDNKCAKLFDIRIIRADSPIEATDILDFTFLMKAMGEIEGDVTLEYWIQRPGTEEKLARGQDVVYMQPWQTKIEDASLYLYKSMIGEYELVIRITYLGYTVEAIRPIEIVEKAPTTLTTNLLEFNPPKFTLQIGTNKDREIEVSLVETITRDNKIVWQDKKQISVQKTLTLEEQMTGLEAGTYELKITAEAEGKTSELTRTFTLEKEITPVIEQPGQIGWLKNMLLILLYSIGVLGILIAVFYTGRTIARHDITKEGRQRVKTEIRGMKNKIKEWRRKGFDTRRITRTLTSFKAKDLGFRELKDIASRTGTKTIKQLRKAGEFGKETMETLGTNTLEQTRELSERTIDQLKKTGDIGTNILAGARDTTSQILQAGGEALTAMETNLLNRIRYWKEKGADTSILERRLRKLRKMPAPPKPVLKKIEKPAVRHYLKPATAKPLEKPRTIKPAPKPIKHYIRPIEKPRIIKPKPAEHHIKTEIIRKIKPAVKHHITPIEKPKIITKPVKPARPHLTAPRIPLKIKELEHKLEKWKTQGFDTRILERQIKKARKRRIEEIKPAKKETATERLRNKLKEKIKEWKAKGYNTTILEQKLKEAETGKTRIIKHSENKILSRIAEWKAKGYNTAMLEKQLTPKEGLEVKIEALEDKIKLWKAKGYNTILLEQKLKRLKKR